MKKSIFSLLTILTISTVLPLTGCYGADFTLEVGIDSVDGSHVKTGGTSKILEKAKDQIENNPNLTELAKINAKQLLSEMFKERYIGNKHFHIGHSFYIRNISSELKDGATRTIGILINTKAILANSI